MSAVVGSLSFWFAAGVGMAAVVFFCGYALGRMVGR